MFHMKHILVTDCPESLRKDQLGNGWNLNTAVVTNSAPWLGISDQSLFQICTCKSSIEVGG